jgi:16S rRNA (guanine966-N2)-methyltransferase
MRIIAGTLKGRRLKPPGWEGLRPTSDKLRETLFNVLSPRLPGSRILDAYAGTGAIGLEALSRGAAHVVFVDKDRRAVGLIRENLQACVVSAGYTIEQGDVGAVLAGLPLETRFDIIVLDPPYQLSEVSDVLDAAGSRLEVGGVLVLERATRLPPRVPPSLTHMRDIRSGDSTLTLLERRERR